MARSLVNDFKYCLDPGAETPIMLLDRPIGYDPENPNEPYIDGATFQRELLALDAAGVKNIDVWISSVGGSVVDGMMIYNTMLQTKCAVNTHTVFAASIAAVIAQAGKKRTMADFGQMMYHNTSGGDDKALAAMNESIINMVQRRSNMSYDEIRKMMNRTTWIGADEALALGLCDSIEKSDSMNAPRRLSGDAKAMWKEAVHFVNSALKTPTNKMKGIATALGLEETATEEQIVTAIADMKSAGKTANDQVTALGDQVKSLSDVVNSLKAKQDDNDKAAQAAAAAAARSKAELLVNKYAPRLGTSITDEVKNSWIDKAIADHAGTEKMLEALPVNYKAPRIENSVATPGKDAEGKDIAPCTVAVYAARVTNQLKKEGRNVYCG